MTSKVIGHWPHPNSVGAAIKILFITIQSVYHGHQLAPCGQGVTAGCVTLYGQWYGFCVLWFLLFKVILWLCSLSLLHQGNFHDYIKFFQILHNSQDQKNIFTMKICSYTTYCNILMLVIPNYCHLTMLFVYDTSYDSSLLMLP